MDIGYRPLQVIPRILENRWNSFSASAGTSTGRTARCRLVLSPAQLSHALEYQSLFRLPLAEFPAVQDMQSNFSELFARPVDLLWTPGVN